MAKVELNNYRDNEFLGTFFDLNDNVLNMDLSTLSNDRLVELYNECDAVKNLYDGLQQTVKDLANSLYGALGSPFFRFYNNEVAGDITNEGKMFMFVVDYALNDYYKSWESDPTIESELQQKFPNQKIKIKNVPKNHDIATYGDTDSRYIEYGIIFDMCGFVPKNPQEACDFITFMEEIRIKKLIEDSLHDYIVERNGKLGYMIMELETISGKSIFLCKKKYVMSLFWKDGKYIADKGKIKSTGVEIQQTNTSQFVKKSIKAVLHKLLTPGTKTTDVYKLGTLLINRAKVAPVDELLNAKGIKEYSKYVKNDRDTLEYHDVKGISASVRAAAEYNHFIHINGLGDRFPRYIGGKIYFYYALNKAGVFGVPDGVSVADIPGAPEINYEMQVEKLIINPMKRYIFSSDIDKSTFGKKDALFSFNKFKRV